MNLPYDYSRCFGTTQATCMQCRRREPGRPEWQSYIAPQIKLDGSCDSLIPYEGARVSSSAQLPERAEQTEET